MAGLYETQLKAGENVEQIILYIKLKKDTVIWILWLDESLEI